MKKTMSAFEAVKVLIYENDKQWRNPNRNMKASIEKQRKAMRALGLTEDELRWIFNK